MRKRSKCFRSKPLSLWIFWLVVSPNRIFQTPSRVRNSPSIPICSHSYYWSFVVANKSIKGWSTQPGLERERVTCFIAYPIDPKPSAVSPSDVTNCNKRIFFLISWYWRTSILRTWSLKTPTSDNQVVAISVGPSENLFSSVGNVSCSTRPNSSHLTQESPSCYIGIHVSRFFSCCITVWGNVVLANK